jgi:hypothetical protein
MQIVTERTGKGDTPHPVEVFFWFPILNFKKREGKITEPTFSGHRGKPLPMQIDNLLYTLT